MLSEAEAGDSDAARRRLTQLAGLPVLKASADVQRLVKHFIGAGGISPSFVEDAFHVAIATVNAIDYVLTWNCRHIANAEIAARLKIVANEEGYTLPLLCTPEQLMGD